MLDARMDRRSLLRGAAAMGLPLGATARPSTIADDAGHEMPYAWSPASHPRRARTLVVLHGNGPHATPSAPSAPGWNVLAPIDRYGYQGHGSWWLGEGGDYFVAGLLHALIRQKRGEIGRDAGLYFCGSSMGGYGALLHGMLMGARAVFANAFQSRLSGTRYTDAMARYLDPIGVPAASPNANLARYVRGKSVLPVLFLDFNRYDHADLRYYQEHFVPFVAACKDVGADYHAKVYPLDTHSQPRPFSGVLRLLGSA